MIRGPRTLSRRIPDLSLRTSDFDFELPADRIAQFPAQRREESRLLVVDRETGELRDRRFADIVELFGPDDVLVVNETRVFPARLRGQRRGGGKAEALLLHPVAGCENVWEALVRPGGKLGVGKSIDISPELSLEVVKVLESGNRAVRVRTALPLEEALERYGEVPLPPYVTREVTDVDRERYQTVYARERGSVAAPTAGLHFTPELLARLEAQGVAIARIVLHVGVGTFRPVEVDDPSQHRMHSEWYDVPTAAADLINERRGRGGRVWAVGTTAVRTLESVASEFGEVAPGQGWTDIFIRPPYRFRVIDNLITNFHLPRSTLMMLVASLAGMELTMKSYRHAIDAGYRFYSYGDAMAVI